MIPVRSLYLTMALIAAASAGCIGAIDQDLDPDEAQPATKLPHATALTWSTQGDPLEEHADTLTVITPTEDIGALHVHVQATAQAPGSSITSTLHHPNGDTYPLAATAAQPEPSSMDTWHILPGFDGTQSAPEIHLEATGETTFETTVHLAPPQPAPRPTQATGPNTPPILAIVDTGVNPYHDAFKRPNLATEDLPQRIQETPLTLPTTQQATYQASLRHDATAWTHAPSNQLVHFQGTNLLGIDLRERTLPQLPIIDQGGHGTSVAHAAMQEAPGTIIVMITAEDYDDGVRWAAKQPWIDLISLSWGPATNPAGAAEPHLTGFDTHEATRQAHEAGKLVFAATANDPTPSTPDTTSGPPWVHAVSGAEPDANGRALLSGNLVDTVANWTQTLASHTSTNETRTASGTSFATPTTAGIAAAILHDARERTAHHDGPALVNAEGTIITASDLRHALNRTAQYWETTDHEDPTIGPSLPPAPAPWLNMGWGYLEGAIVPTATDALLGQSELPEKPSEAEAFMEANLELRRTWWHDIHQG